MKSKRMIAALLILAALIAGTAYAYKKSTVAYQPAAYTFTKAELADLRELIANGESAEALDVLDGRLSYSAITFIINPRTGKYHFTDCATIEDIIYPVAYCGTSEEAKAAGFSPCGRCKP